MTSSNLAWPRAARPPPARTGCRASSTRNSTNAGAFRIVLPKGVRAVFADDVVRVAAPGEGRHPHPELGFEQDREAPEGGAPSSGVGVEGEDDVAGLGRRGAWRDRA